MLWRSSFRSLLENPNGLHKIQSTIPIPQVALQLDPRADSPPPAPVPIGCGSPVDELVFYDIITVRRGEGERHQITSTRYSPSRPW